MNVFLFWKRLWSKRWLRILGLLLTLWVTERLCHGATEGFRLCKVQHTFPYRADWEPQAQKFDASWVQEPYYFLGSGGQCYAFVSKDGTRVLKLFKTHHMHMWEWLERIPLPSFLDRLRNQYAALCADKREHLFTSSMIAFEKVRAKTGMLYLHLNATPLTGTITIVDKLGIAHEIDPSQTLFALQSYAEPFYPTLRSWMDNQQQERALKGLFSLLHLIVERSQQGIADRDPIVKRNFGFVDGEAVEIDIGSFFTNEELKKPHLQHLALFFETAHVRSWLKRHYPSLYQEFHEHLQEMLRCRDPSGRVVDRMAPPAQS